MDIQVRLAFDERAALRLLNWLARENARIFHLYDQRAKRHGTAPLPGIYESGIVYRREEEEVWSDYLNMLLQGHEDCDALAAGRAGELLARGWRALHPRSATDPMRYPGDGGYAAARYVRPRRIRAEVMLTTKTDPGETGLYHCIVRYWVGRREYRDDPSLRLGMHDEDGAMRSRAHLLASLNPHLRTADGRNRSSTDLGGHNVYFAGAEGGAGVDDAADAPGDIRGFDDFADDFADDFPYDPPAPERRTSERRASERRTATGRGGRSR